MEVGGGGYQHMQLCLQFILVLVQYVCTVCGAIKQRIQSSHIPLCHRHMVIATTLSQWGIKWLVS